MSLFNRINTSTPATPSLFGTANSQPQQTPSLFTSTSTPGGGLFGGASTSNPPAASSAPASGGFFGTPQQAPASSAGGSLFSPAPATAPATGGGLFGGGATTSAPATGGLFGGTAPATTSAPAAGGGLFGGTAPAAGGGLFGGTAPAAATGGGLFGTPAQKTAGSLFSPAPATGGNTLNTGGGFGLGSSTAPKPNLFGGATTVPQQQQGQQQGQQQQQNTVPAATVDITRLTPTTRFGDCHESVQQELEQLEKHIQDQIRAAQELSALFPSHRAIVETIPSDTKVLAHKLSTTKSFLAADQAALQAAQQHHIADNEAATLSIRCLDLFRLPPQQRTQYFQRSEQENEVTSNGPMIAYFNNHAAGMEKKLRIFLESVGEVEASLRSVEQQAAIGASSAGINGEDLIAMTGGVGGRQDARMLNRTLREFNDALKDVSARIVDVKDGLRELKAGRR
ncbi:uncharacterized protein H6S33_009720 [Morchella sextelata]|uniref:uncharacterized protein n=1 Tax=Morchella sextelata TaxID=1174677 RepID=UPI001D042216|nr:uncharacterized protein H6S33_009720 [Morchella sextelata]KAH0613340.1 hypothetical protein H6S33_009720 [Morchella sextelata]